MDRACVRWAYLWLAVVLLAPTARATTYNSPTVDGVPPQVNPEGGTQAARDASWAADELLADDPVGDSAWGPNNDLHGVWVTWDADGIYFSVEGAVWDTPSGVGANAVNLYIDVDYGEGTGYGDLATLDQNALDAITRNFWRPLVVQSGFGVDWGYTSWSGRFDLGFLDVRDPDAPVNLFEGVNGQTSALNESAEGVIEARDQDGNAGYELYVPWEVFYPTAGVGRVPAGTRIALVIAQVGGGDSLSPESLPDGADDRIIERPLVFTVDGDGDGIPDANWPPNGTISGLVTLSDVNDTTSVIEVVAYPEGSETIVGRSETPPGGGEYTIDRLQPGNYRVEVNALDFCAPAQNTTVVENIVSQVDFTVDEAQSGLRFSLGFAGGPEATSQVSNISVAIRRVSDERLVTDQLFGPGDDTSLEFGLCDGDYEISAFATNTDPAIGTGTGYRAIRRTVTVSGTGIIDLGELAFELVVPTRFVFYRGIDGATDPIRALRVPRSERFTLDGSDEIDFERSEFVRGALEFAAVDDDGNEAWLTDDVRNAIGISITSIDPRFPSLGIFDYWVAADTSRVGTNASPTALDTLVPTIDGRTRARFLVSGSRRETARLRASNGAIFGDLELAITSQLPSSLDFSVSDLSLVAGDSAQVAVTVLDVLGEAIREEEQQVEFAVTPSTGDARVTPNPAFTDGDGRIGANGDVVFTTTSADTFEVVARIDNGVTTVETDPIRIVVSPGVADAVEVRPQIASIDSIAVDVQITDRFGNPVGVVGGRTLDVTVGPVELVDAVPATVDVDETGAGRFVIDIVPGLPGVLDIRVDDPSLPNGETRQDFALLAGLTGIDEAAPESTEPNSLAGVDLTTFAVQIRDGDFVFTIPFSSTFGGMHIGMAIEVGETAVGGTSDPFVFPITFGYENLPDFALTYKYSANDYGDFRRWNPGTNAWEWYDWANETFVASFADGVNVVAQEQVVRSNEDVTFRVPVSVVAPGFRPGVDTLRAQVYLMQEEDQKRKPFDSIPEDETLDMVIGDTVLWDAFGDTDTDPSATERLIAYLTGTDGSGNTILSQYVEFSPLVIGNSLTVDAIGFTPETTTQEEDLLITVEPGFPEGEAPADPIFQVFADLSALGGDAAQRMNDDGENGDVTADDGVYSILYRVPSSQFAGEVDVVVRTLELTTSQELFTSGSIEVIGDPELTPVISFVDAIGDDHGPNQPGEQFLFYEYPTNSVFFDGVFDLHRLDVFTLEEQMLFRVTVGEITDPSNPLAANWGATYPSDNNCPAGQRTDFNLQNVVILLDTKEGIGVGSTEIPDNRWADIAPQDAWEYAIVFDGWWKGLIKSNGSSSSGAWEVVVSDAEYFFCASAASNTIDGFVDLGVFDAEELEDVLEWDVIVMMSGHDGESSQDNWGGVRWVNDGEAEWQFGGGRNGEDGRERDPNIIDVMTLNGLQGPSFESRKAAGRAQEALLNYLTPEARARFAREDRPAAVVLEATEFIDVDPPSLDIVGATTDRAVVRNAVLEDGPVVIRANISDDSGVETARMFWWAPGEDPSARREVPMGKLRGDLDPGGTEFVADIRWEEVADATDSGVLNDPTALADSLRYIYVAVEATDIAGNSTVPTTGSEAERFESPEVIELPVEPVREIRYPDLLAGDDVRIDIDLNDGSRWSVDRSVLEEVLGDAPGTLELVLRTIPRAEIDAAFRASDNETVLGNDNRFLGIARRLELEIVDGDTRTVVMEMPSPAELSLHYPRYLRREEDRGQLTLFRLEEIDATTERWILAAGHAEIDGSTVTVPIDQLGSFAAFTTDVEIDNERYVTGLIVSPNPFTPNGDGLYDEVDISYVLPDDTNRTTIEIYDVRGQLVRELQRLQADEIVGRTLGIKWDGRDDGGRLVPMGIYVVRIEVESRNENNDGNQPRVERATKALAVVR